ncbi:MAG TPA: hypothetical protein VG323_18135, partial [Thermoanaerobaculia bacterium]|nr:hypothetical protein [Thermoanaerobaculia bacterium]
AMIEQSRHDAVIVSMSGRAGAGLGPEGFFNSLSGELNDALGISDPPGKETIITSLRPAARNGRQVFLLLDNFERLSTNLTIDDFRFLRSLVDKPFGVMFAIATKVRCRDLSEDVISSDFPNIFFNIGEHAMLEPLERESVRELVEQPAAAAGLALPPGLADTLYALCQGHPSWTTKVCSSLAMEIRNGITPPLPDVFAALSMLREAIADAARELPRRGTPGWEEMSRFVKSEYPMQRGEWPGHVRALLASGLCHLADDGRISPTGSVARRYLREHFDALPEGEREASEAQCKDFKENVQGFENRLRRSVDVELIRLHGEKWHENAEIVDAEQIKLTKQREGARFVDRLTLTELLKIFLRTPPFRDRIQESNLASSQRDTSLIEVRNAMAHERPIMCGKLNKARERLLELSEFLDQYPV